MLNRWHFKIVKNCKNGIIQVINKHMKLMPKRLTATHAEYDDNGNLLAIGEKKLAGPWKHSITEVILNLKKGTHIYYIKGKGSTHRALLNIKDNQILYTNSEQDSIKNLLSF